MITLREASSYCTFWGAVVTVGSAALNYGRFGDLPSFVAGMGAGLVLAFIPAAFMGMYITAKQVGEAQPEQEVKTAARELPAGLLPIHEFTTPTFVKPGQSLLDVDPTGQQRETLVVNANGQQVNAIACLVEAGKTHITYIDVAQMEGKPFGSGRNAMYKQFLAELKKLGLAKLHNGQLHLTERGVWGFTHPLTH